MELILNFDPLVCVLSNTSKADLDKAIEHNSVQTLYDRFQKQLMAILPSRYPTALKYSVEMARVFRPFQADGTRIDLLTLEIKKLKRVYKLQIKERRIEDAKETAYLHNQLLQDQAELMKPYADLIKAHKMAVKELNKAKK